MSKFPITPQLKTVTKEALDLASGLTVFGAVLDYMPEIAAALGILWYIIRMFEWARVAIFKKDRRDL